MTVKATTVFVAAMFASQVALTAVSFADGKKGKGGTGGTTTTTVTSLKAKLAPPAVVGPVAADLDGVCEGEAKYKKKVTVKTPPLPALPSTTTQESFSGEVECPILDVTLASHDVYDMHLGRGTPAVDYAVCSLVIKEIEFEYNKLNPMVPAGMEGEYAVKVSQKMVSPATTPTVMAKIGGCMVQTGVDPLGAPVFGSGVPAVQNLDTATVFLNGGLTPVLTGTFGVGSFDDDDD